MIQDIRILDHGKDITFLDGEKGILRYRGYSIDDLANNLTFLEVAYLLIWGELLIKKSYLIFQMK